MESLIQWTGLGNMGIPGLSLHQALLSFLVAFVLGQLTAWVYILTHSGLSYSRAFVQSIVLLTMIVCLAMLVIGNNVIVAFGLIGALAVIRFRNILKDTRDTAFIFFALIVGMATGTGRYKLAVVGTVLFLLILLYLDFTSFGSRHLRDGFIRFRISSEAGGLSTVQTVLRRYCRNLRLVSQRLTDTGAGEVAYSLIIRDPARADEMVSSLQKSKGVSDVTFILHEEQVEV